MVPSQFFGQRHLICKFAWKTSKYTQSEWKYVALSVEVGSSGFNWSLVAVATVLLTNCLIFHST